MSLLTTTDYPSSTSIPILAIDLINQLIPMRVIGEIPHPECKITVFHWNNRYLIKLEQGPLEQTFKIQEFDLSSEAEIKLIVSEEFIQASLRRFEAMGESLQQALHSL